MNRYIKRFLLLFLSLILALLVAEGLARLFFDPIDFLAPRRIPDQVLRYRLQPHSGAHDSWGFRNKSVPDSAEIVAIGDSHTYGFSATASNSWPLLLQDLTENKVYSLSLGGYGPVEYFYLMKNKAIGLNPRMIIVGLYLGNDLKNAVQSVYEVPEWDDYRDPNFISTNTPITKVDDWFNYGFRARLAANSVIYRIISSSFIGDKLRQQRRINEGQNIPMLNLPETDITTGFTPDRRLRSLDLSNSEVREGLRLTLTFFDEMNQLAIEEQIDFLVVIIPTKEAVYSKYILESDELGNSFTLNKLIQSEEVVNKLVQTYFRDHDIAYIDMLEPLRNAAATKQIYPNNFSGHSNKNGYRIIAESINSHIESENTK